MTVAEKIRQQRRLANISQDELSKRAGVSLKTVQRWEAEQRSPRMEEIQKLATVLGVPVTELLSDSPAELPPMPAPVPEQDKPAEEPLVYEWGGKNRIALPNTPETRELFRQLVQSVIASAPAAVN